jgi:hypothetical protein
MKKGIFLYGLAFVLLLVFPGLTLATEQADAEQTPAEVQLSAEDQKVIALMDLLQKMDMLKDLDLIAAGEVKK